VVNSLQLYVMQVLAVHSYRSFAISACALMCSSQLLSCMPPKVYDDELFWTAGAVKSRHA
jgi:hypothetical protein